MKRHKIPLFVSWMLLAVYVALCSFGLVTNGAVASARTYPVFQMPGGGELMGKVKDLGVVDQLNNHTCVDQNNCPGWCKCDLHADSLVRTFNFFDSIGNKILFGLTPAEVLVDMGRELNMSETHKYRSQTYPFEVRFEFSNKACDITYKRLTPIIPPSTENGAPFDYVEQDAERERAVIKNCTFKASYCCCETDSKTGQPTKCGRSVNYNTGTGQMQCSQNERAIDDKGKGCDSIIANGIKTGSKSEANLELETALKDIKQDASTLNKVKFANLNDVIGQIIYFFLATVGTFAFVLYAYAGVIWLTSAGNSERIERSKQMFLWITLGLFAMLGSYIVVKEIFNFINNTTGL